MDDLDVINHYTRVVIEQAAYAARRAEPGLRIVVAADSDVIFEHAGSGQWFGVTMIGMRPEKRRWVSSRGSLFSSRDVTFPDLAEVQEFVLREVT